MMSFFLSALLFFCLIIGSARAATFEIRNNCPYTIWPGALPGGGKQLNSGGTWILNVAPGTTSARIWPRTGCSFNGAGRGGCQTGDCGGVLNCRLSGKTPVTLAEFSLNQANLDFFDISLVDGFNVQMEFAPTSNGCSKSARCTADINGQCPGQLRVPGGCRNDGTPGAAQFFNSRCPDAYSFPNDRKTLSCPGGTNYRVVFCP